MVKTKANQKVVQTAFMAFLLSALSGCVSLGTEHKLLKKYHATKANLTSCAAQSASQQKQIQALKNKIQNEEVIVSNLESKLGESKSAKLKLEGNVAKMKQALEALKQEQLEAQKRINEFRELTAKFQSLINTGKLTVKIVDGQMVVAMSTDVLFHSGSARLSNAGQAAIKQVTSLLVSVPNHNFQIEGFTDNMPIRTALFPSNWELASARALTVLKTMLKAGMPPGRVSAASFGDTHPVQPNTTNAGRAANRRIEIVVVPDLSDLPGYAELKKLSGQKSPDKQTKPTKN